MKRFAYLDIEATHTNWSDAQIIEIAFIIKDEDGKDVDFFHSLIRSQVKINQKISELTGITENDLKNAPELYQVAQKIYEKLKGCIIVAHKIDFDYDLLNKELTKLQLPLNNKKICTLQLSKELIPELKSYSLKALCSLIQIEIKNHHRALDDAAALSKLHRYLRMIKKEFKAEQNFLPHHLKIINKCPQRPGIVIIKGRKTEIYKTDNLFEKCKELFKICPRNKMRVFSKCQLKVIQSGTFVQASLLQAKYEKSYYPFCIYMVKNKKGKLLLKIGKTTTRLKAVYYVKTKKEAKDIIQNLLTGVSRSKLLYYDGGTEQSQIIKENLDLLANLKKIVSFRKNYLIGSTDKVNDKYHYTLIRGDHSFCCFETSTKINKSDEIQYDCLRFKRIGPREYMALNYSLICLKNQKRKTDYLLEVKNENSKKVFKNLKPGSPSPLCHPE